MQWWAQRRACSPVGNPFDVGTDGRELFFEPLIAAVEVIDAADDGFALGGQTRQDQADRGAHVNVSGVVMTKYAKHPEAAQRLMEYLVGDQAQQLYAELNKEYPVKSGVALSPLVASWGQFSADDLSLVAIAKQRAQAMTLLDEVKFDL